MPKLSIKSHLEYLNKHGTMSPKTLDNYAAAIKRLDIDDVDSDNLEALWTYLDSCLPEYDSKGILTKGVPYSYILHANTLASSLLKQHGIESKGPGYDKFRARLGKYERTKVGAYSEKEIKLILKKCGYTKGFGLYRFLIFLIYTGASVSSGEGVKISDFGDVPGYDKVKAVRLRGRKGHPYVAIISKKAARHIWDYDPHHTDRISGYDGSQKSDFATYNRAELAYTISRAGVSDQVTQNRNIMNSFRKFFVAKLFEDGIESDNINLLIGNVPKSLAYKAGSAGMEKMTERAATAYSKSRFVEWEAWAKINGGSTK